MDRKPTDSISRSTSSSRMSHSSDEGDQNKASSCRKWVEPQSVPSRCLSSRRGYCGYCRVFYGNLNQHLSSLKHLDSVRTCSQGSSTVYSTSWSGTSQTLLERFLHDVLQYHPHLYEDTRPSHADLPSVSTLPLPRKEFDEVCLSDQTREHLLSPAGTCFPLADYDGNCHLVTEDVPQERLSGPIGKWVEERMTPLVHEQTPPPPTQTQPTVHRKAHRKTNRRKNSNDRSPPQRDPDPGSEGPTELGPWLSWQKERREAQKEQAFSLDHSDPLDQTIEEVIQRCCHGIRSPSCQQEESESFHLSLPLSMETQTNDWDSDVQVALQTPFLISHVDAKDLSHLMLVQVDLEDQVYTYHLDCALQHERQAGHGARLEEGCWTLPIEEVLPAPEHIPESFRGKTWAQIEQEDEEKVEKLVQQFRREKFICYFDSESLARFGRRSNKKRWDCENKEVVRGNGVLPLLDISEEDSAYIRRKRGMRHVYRVASRCQAVKVSHSTQTVRAVVPAVREHASEILSSNAAANQDASAERTPDAQTWHRLPASYLKIMTPLQPRTSLVYLLCSPSSSTNTVAVCPTRKHWRKKRRPLDLQGLKVTYKQLPVRFYEPSSNRVLKNPPKGFLRHRGSTSSSVPPSCVRQLFRNLSPDLNADAHSFFLSTCDRDVADADKQHTVRGRDRMSQAPPYSRLERGRGLRKERTCPVVSKSTVRTEAPAPQSRRGLRQAGCDRKDPNSGGPPYSVQSRQRNSRGRGRKRRQR